MKDKTIDFIDKAIKIHGYKYDYSKVEYIDSKTKVCIICPIHGEFWQRPSKHLSGQGCKKCSYIKNGIKCRKTLEQFITQSKEVHGDKYDYSKVKYVNGQTKVCIICPIHGEFYQTPESHLSGNGCNQCGIDITTNKLKDNLLEFIDKSKKIHGDRYDYSKVEYVNSKTHVKLKCNRCGFEFYVKPNNHISSKSGCPRCNKSMLENEIELLLKDNKIDYIFQYRPKFLQNGKKSLSIDFYLPKYNIAIECQGIQHFKDVGFLGKPTDFNAIIERDRLKYELCVENDVKLIYFTNVKDIPNNYFSTIYSDLNELLDMIKS